jgi:YggT family protein
MLTLIVYLLNALLLALLAYSILSWYTAYARVSYDSPVRKVQKVLSAVCDPILNPVRRVIPMARVGGVGLDLSVLIVILVIDLILIPVVRGL